MLSDETKPDKTKPLTGKILANKDFNLEAMRKEINQKRPVIHIASHFNFAPTSDNESFLLLGEGKWTVKEMRGIGQLFGGVQLLTLSACNTAMGGKDATGKEVDGFGTFAQDKGAQAVIATLWSVADDSTAELMRKFYELRADDNSLLKAEALRLAQLDLIYGKHTADEKLKMRGTTVIDLSGKQKQPDFKEDKNARYAHPYFWSPFVLFGNWR